MQDLVHFAKRYGTPKLRAAALPALSLYMAWCLQRNAVGAVAEEGEIIALGIAWPVRDDGPLMADPGWNPMRAAVPESPLIYVANMTAPDAEARQRLIAWAAQRYPAATSFCAHRERASGNQFVRYSLRRVTQFYANES